VRTAFHNLLEAAARQFEWTLVPEYPLKRKHERPLKVDGALIDIFHLHHGFWEAKDSDDNLDNEIKTKFKAGYPRDNILFQAPERAVLFQNGERVFDADLTKPEQLVEVLRLFLEFAPPAFMEWEQAVDEFKIKIPELAEGLAKLLRQERKTNPKFRATFDSFFSMCKTSLNPNLVENAVEEMLIQHLLTERIFRKVFDVADFMQRNVIAAEIEKVIAALTSHHFSRDEFLTKLERFYGAIENAAATIKDYHQKQTFLNTVYERFFQGFCVKVADTHGIVYTPQPLVDFMVSSVERVLLTEFKKSLGDRNVHIIDPFTGTGNFIVNLIRRIKKFELPYKFDQELHCNEVMLLPYYVASMNIEHSYFEEVGSYMPFEGICLVDTFETAEDKQLELALFNEQNYARVERQKKAEIKVILANPPYNAGQINENDNNKNRKYRVIDSRVSLTYGKASAATLVRKLSDPYVKAIRYASDRLGETGIICYVNNNSFIAEKTFDGMRKHLARDFDLIYILDLGGNVRKNPELSGTTHNVFGIQVGVSINLFIRLPGKKPIGKKEAQIYYYAVPVHWRREQKYAFLDAQENIAGVKWDKLTPDAKYNWLTNQSDKEFSAFLPFGTKEAKAKGGGGIATIFSTYSLGVSTNRDAAVYDFDAQKLARRVEQFCEDYNAEVGRWVDKGRPKDVDNFVNYDKIKWSSTLKNHLRDIVKASFNEKRIVESIYRPFTRMNLYYDRILVDRPGAYTEYFPTKVGFKENLCLIVNLSPERPFCCLACNIVPSKDVAGGFGSPSYCFPFYTYSPDGKERRENIKPSALQAFQEHYGDNKITKWDIFHYAYALLHHSDYRARFAENLKRELPRLPFAPEFWPFAIAGKKLADLHVGYEQQKEYPLNRVENRDVHLGWRVETMKLSKDRQSIIYNDYLTLKGIPPEAFKYQLGNRSALEWVIDQYRVVRDEHDNVVSDPNRLDDEEYIVRLIGQVIIVSIETLKLSSSLPSLKF
jgi:predicted helicase